MPKTAIEESNHIFKEFWAVWFRVHKWAGQYGHQMKNCGRLWSARLICIKIGIFFMDPKIAIAVRWTYFYAFFRQTDVLWRNNFFLTFLSFWVVITHHIWKKKLKNCLLLAFIMYTAAECTCTKGHFFTLSYTFLKFSETINY